VSEQHPLRGRAPGNREVSRLSILGELGHLRAVLGEANPKRRGSVGTLRVLGSHERSDERGVFA
jgi:hypothetical protein